MTIQRLGLNRFALSLGAVGAVVVAFSLIVVKNAPGDTSKELVNVSYDPTRELYQRLNPLFVASYEKATGQHLAIVQSHGGSSWQARKIISGEQQADVVTLGLFTDIDSLRKRGLIAAGWADRLPNHSLPYTSTIVFVVRKDNPRGIKDWPDLLTPGVEIVTPNPRTSGNGKLAALAAWAAVVTRGGTDTEARAYLASLYRHVSDMDEGARGAAIRFALQEIGDVHLTWENEAIREVAESNGKLEIVYPPVSILAEPYVAWVDSTVARDGNLAPAKAYLNFLFTDAAQAAIAHLGYRPYKSGIWTFPSLTLVPITAIARDWDGANEKFFAENGVIDSILGSQPK
ncbi:sulfate ABC transporter substrate-binding protein [Acidisphaera sp. S103]|uniref:sulfate ABC transporter substrate-binding protein n=1 Tax=Acidisphaera sp. S103 TaxID=1747223 RepID=UPI00131AAB96|nr:sulfate ABC transporter substrate-binding protein [Acidisphaera sp. S103]